MEGALETNPSLPIEIAIFLSNSVTFSTTNIAGQVIPHLAREALQLEEVANTASSMAPARPTLASVRRIHGKFPQKHGNANSTVR
jgi:hypothetical protein